MSADDHAEENRIENLFVRICEPKAEVTRRNNKRLIMRSRYCTVEANDSRAGSLRQLSFLFSMLLCQMQCRANTIFVKGKIYVTE